MKNLLLCLVVGLSIGISAQENDIIVDEGGVESALILVTKETNVPVCRLSGEVRMNPEFIQDMLPERVNVADEINIEEIRICQEEDISDAIDEEMLIGGVPAGGSGFLSALGRVAGIGSVLGCLSGLLESEWLLKKIEESSMKDFLHDDASLIMFLVAGISVGREIPLTFGLIRVIGGITIGGAAVFLNNRLCSGF